jgi:hypothetical protein
MNPPSRSIIMQAAEALNSLQMAAHTVTSVSTIRSGPVDKAGLMLGQMLRRANDAIKDDFAQITMGKLPRYDVILRDKKTGELFDPATGQALSKLP